MLMKVFNKGQVVIPVEIRRILGIEPGDKLELEVDRDHRSIALHKPEQSRSKVLAGSLSQYGENRTFPTRKQMAAVLAEEFGK